MIENITDNKWGISKEAFISKYPLISDVLLDRTLNYLAKESNIILFPETIAESEDLDEDSKIIETYNSEIKTGNVVGFIGKGNEQLIVRSRFSKGNDDYFLYYMLKKVLNINLANLPIGISFEDQIYKLLCYVFPHFLKNALKKGLYREYRRFNYNDNCVRGSIDISRHIRNNVPFLGRIAYSTRELTTDNRVIHLIRHTIDFLSQSETSKHVLYVDRETRNFVDKIIENTPNVQFVDRFRIIQENRNNPVIHPYYHEYLSLQKLCLMILEGKKHGFDIDGEQMYGILFDVSWLWEEYLNCLLEGIFIHPENKKRKQGISLYKEKQRTVFPDFYNVNKKIVLDAKYKNLIGKSIVREDLYQIISYLHVLKFETAGVVSPSKEERGRIFIGNLAGFGGEIFKFPFYIPQNCMSFEEFEEKIELVESQFITEMTSS